MAHFFRLIAFCCVCVLLCFPALHVHAEGSVSRYKVVNSGIDTGWHSSVSQACNSYTSTLGSRPGITSAAVTRVFESQLVCWYSYAINGNETTDGLYVTADIQLCPEGSKVVDNKCVSLNDDDKKCGDPFKYAGWHLGGPYTDFQHLDGKVEDGAEFCVPFDPIGPKKGCKVSFSMNGQHQNDDKSWSTYGKFAPVEKTSGGETKGEACTATDSEDPKDGEGKKPKEPECKDGYKGEVNGVTTCVPNVKKNGVDFAPEKKTEELLPEGTKKETEKKTSCENGKCTTTTTTKTTDKNGNSVTQTSKTEESEKAFCSANPSKCKDGKADAGKGDEEKEGEKGKFGGGCSAGFTCEGDAIQCAIAQEQHKRSCELFVNESDESKLYKSEVAKGRNRDVTKMLPGNSDVDVSDKLSRDDLLGGARCISDLSVTVWNTNVSLPLSKICPQLEYMGWVLVAVSTLVAFRIVSGSSRES